MLKSSLCDYSEAYILVKETISVANTAVSAATSNTKKNIFRNCAPLTDCIIEINNIQVAYAKDIDVVMLVYN